ncbi:heavy metal translocating P-type ATPase [Virgibacillus phasianinus]|uniref:Heavy metal translocating P-type ATPase n=1 Tax=Virgibacillus phasianinus TaxID=2017483 RepID=A0A220TZJ3_9BACI|nr:heavy metal translocating P-type ATPase [Virgibacillus phasianinus]ASK61081.1 heavy metal translocating P-type ATPase [Virgibacillus phasianinus]
MTTKSEILYDTNGKRLANLFKSPFFQKAYEHIELIAALLSGLTILITWFIADYINYPAFVILHLIAFAIGGFAKAKEGIEETVANKELNVEMLMVFAAIGSAAIGYWTEGAILIFIFALSGALETYTMNKSKKEISSLMNLQPETALCLINGIEKVIPVSELEIDHTILVKAGERIPADGIILKGNSSINESTITGESIPVNKQVDQEVYAGTVAIDGTIHVRISKPTDQTLFQKIINLVQSAQDEKSPSQLFIERFEGTYVKAVLLAVGIMMFLPYLLFGWTLTESVYRAMILLVVASPCALVASIMPATLSAISKGAKNGVLFKGGVNIENLSHVKAIAFDKTGTLTNGKPVVTDVYFQPGVDEQHGVEIIGAIENESLHPLAQAIADYSKQQLEIATFTVDVQHHKTTNGNGVQAQVGQDTWKIGKAQFVGEKEADEFQDGTALKLASEGKSLVFIKKNDKVIGLLALKDTIRKEAKQAIKQLKKRNIFTVMLTGDNDITAKAIAAEAGIDDYIAGCLPEEKVNHVKVLRNKFEHVAMVGDGINDAPALATANVGIAMGEGTDVALETADVVLMKNDLPKIAKAFELSKTMNKIVKQNIVFSLSVILLLIVSNLFQVLDLPLGVVGHEGSTILVILNGLRLLR